MIEIQDKTRVVVTDVRIPFGSMVWLIFKAALASIPATILLAIVFALVWTFLGVFAGNLGRNIERNAGVSQQVR